MKKNLIDRKGVAALKFGELGCNTMVVAPDEYVSLKSYFEQGKGILSLLNSVVDAWMMEHNCRLMADYVERMSELMDQFYKEQQRCPSFVLNGYLDMKGHKEDINRMVIYVDAMGEKWEEMGGEDAGKLKIENLHDNLLIYRDLLSEIYKGLSEPNDAMLERLYEEVDGLMERKYDLRSSVSAMVSQQKMQLRGDSVTSEDVNKWKGEMFLNVKQELSGLEEVLGYLRMEDKYRCAVARYIYSQYQQNPGRTAEEEELWLRKVMETVYAYEQYQQMMNKRVSIASEIGSSAELNEVVDLLKAIPTEWLNENFTNEMLRHLWSDLLNSALHDHIIKHGKLNMRFVCVLIGRILHHQVYVNVNPTMIAKQLVKVYSGMGKEANFRSYISSGQQMCNETQDTVNNVDSIIEGYLVKKSTIMS